MSVSMTAPTLNSANSSKMAVSDDHKILTKAFSGLGVDEKAFVSVLAKWNPKHRQSYRKSTHQFFRDDERQFERWDDHHVLQLRQEFLRLKDAVVLYMMHPWERDARLFKEALLKEPQFDLLIETACTRPSEELLGARRAYHSLFDHSIEEDIAFHIQTPERKLLVALVSSYRYEGPKVHEDVAKSEAKVLANAIKHAGNKNLVDDEEIVRILSTRSKLHLLALYKHYKEITGKFLDEDLHAHLLLKQTVQCLCMPQLYFSKILDASLRLGVDEAARDSVTRVIVTRADEDMKHIKQEFKTKYGVALSDRIGEVANGSYKELLLTLVAKSE
ncbi:PREDICTED: annexin D4 [Ipomoea nil]|uniref:annexin D4 n=1 Tax=Ipomoea nil TaxID=35883 RepID=UPI000900B04D|nr:PREDICTED: annexin D4 [Ipomoea nil]